MADCPPDEREAGPACQANVGFFKADTAEERDGSAGSDFTPQFVG